MAASWMRMAAAVIGVLAVAGAACGGDASEPDPDPASTTTTVADIQNRNDRSSALGRLCWVRREIVLALDDVLTAVLPYSQGEPVDDARFRRGVDRMSAAVGVATTDLVPSDPSLPDPVRAFQDRVIDAAARARPVIAALPGEPSNGQSSQAFTDLGAIFNFGGFTGLRAYVDAAAVDAGCPDP